MSRRYFEESQRFNQPWIWILLSAVSVSVLFGLAIGTYEELRISDNLAESSMTNAGLILTLIFTTFILAGVWTLILSTRLETKVDPKGIYYRFNPFISAWKFIPKEELEYYEVKKYKPILHYGGWGYRIGIKGRALNVRGNMGLDIKMKDGKKLLLGTQKPTELKMAIERLREAEFDA
jgi:hypothetical protein